MKISRIFFLVTVLQFTFNYNYSQSTDEKIVQDLVVKNIISFNIVQSLKGGDVKGKYILTNNPPRLFKYLPSANGELLIELNEISESDLKYPKESYILYSIYLDGYRIKYENHTSVYSENNIIPKEYYLAAYDPSSKRVKFISGNYWLNMIADDFHFDNTDPSSYEEFIKMKTFDMLTDKITLKIKKKNKMIFTAYSKKTNKEILITLNLKKPDFIEIH